MNQIFRDYQLVTQLARNAPSRLYLAQPIAASTENVVIRIFDPISANFAQERFQYEINQFTQLRHPFILPLLSGGIEQGHPYLVSGYAPGDSLRNRLAALRPRPFPLAKALLTIVQLGQALAYAHAWNIVHANIKPENVLFNTQDQALLADFIPSSLMESYSPHQRTDAQSACYKAPEQLAGKVSMESDQYALGCIAYEILTGQPPFTVVALPTGQFKRTSEHPAPLSHIIPGLPQHVDVAVCKALASEPRERHTSVAVFMEALTAYSLKVTTASSSESMMSAPAMEELDASSWQTPLTTSVHDNELREPILEKSAFVVLPTNSMTEDAAMRGSNPASPTVVNVSVSPIPVMPPPLIPQTPRYLRNTSPDKDADAKWKSLSGEKSRVRRRKGLMIGMGITLAVICLLLLGVSVLPQLLFASDARQSDGKTPTAPISTPAQETPTAKPSIQPTATATHKPKPTPTATPSPTPTPTKPPTPTPTPPPPTPTPTPKPTRTPTPTPTPCRGLFC